MSLPHNVAPVLTVVGTPALAYAAARSLWHATRAVVLMVASFVAMKTADDNRRDACLEIVDRLTCRSGQPSGPAAPEQPADAYGAATGELDGPPPARRPPRSRVRSRRARDLCAPPRSAGLVPGQATYRLADLTWSFAVTNFAQPVVQLAPTSPIALVVTNDGMTLEMTTGGSAGAVTSVLARPGPSAASPTGPSP